MTLPSVVLEQVQNHAATILGLVPVRLDPQRDLRELGLDSLMMLDLVSRLETTFRLSLPATPFTGKRTVEAIARSLSGELSQRSRTDGAELSTAPAVARGIATRIRPHLDVMTRAPEFETFVEALPCLDVLSNTYVLQAFDRLGWDLVPGERVSASSLAKRLHVNGKHLRLLDRLLEMLSEDGVLRAVGAEWEVLRPVEAVERVTAEESRHDTQSAAVEIESALLRRCGQRLADVLRGDFDPLRLWFSADGGQLIETLYRDSPPMRVLNTLAREAVKLALGNITAGRRLRILEIGAGTGGTASYLLPVLDGGRIAYSFTDVAPLFLTRAAERFRQYRFVRYERLDIEKDPASQGFPGEAYDIIVACHVLHATRNLRSTLRHVRGLLVPGGLLVLAELTGPQRWLDLVFGLTEGWWRFEDFDVRPSYPLISIERWLELLISDGGFAEAAAVPAVDEAERYLAGRGALLLAQARS